MEQKLTSRPRERILEARALADAEVDRRLGRHTPLPEVLETLLGTAWNNVLVLTLLRHGRASEQWQAHLACMDDLIWTVQPKRSAADVARLQSMLPQLSRTVRAAMLMVAFEESEVDLVFEQLRGIYCERMAEQYREKLHMPTARSARPARPWQLLRPAEFQPKALEAPAPPVKSGQAGPPGNSYLRAQVEALRAGAWLEFAAPDGARVRAKLSWVSPISKNYLFVTEQGTKLADKSLDELVEEVARGETLLLDASPTFRSPKR